MPDVPAQALHLTLAHFASRQIAASASQHAAAIADVLQARRTTALEALEALLLRQRDPALWSPADHLVFQDGLAAAESLAPSLSPDRQRTSSSNSSTVPSAVLPHIDDEIQVLMDAGVALDVPLNGEDVWINPFPRRRSLRDLVRPEERRVKDEEDLKAYVASLYEPLPTPAPDGSLTIDDIAL